MANSTVHERFAANGQLPFEYDGYTVSTHFRKSVVDGDRFEIQCTKFRKDLDQLLHLHGIDCQIEIFGKAMHDGFLDPNDIIKPTTVKIVQAKEGAQFLMWNMRMLPGAKLCCLGNFGVRIRNYSSHGPTGCLSLEYSIHEGSGKPKFDAMTIQWIPL